jgi:hypothetical protein
MITLITITITLNCSESSEYICIYSIYIYNRNVFQPPSEVIMANIHMFVLSYYYNILTTTVKIITLNIYYYLSWKYVNKNALSYMRVCQYLTVVVTIARSTIRSKIKEKNIQKVSLYWRNVEFIFGTM